MTPPLPRELQVEVTGACNLRCRMCLVRYRPAIGRQEGSLPLARVLELLDALPDLERLTLQGLGEPLLAPDLVDMVAAAKARGIAVGFNTNATLLTPDRSERLLALGIDWLHVSLDGATPGTYEEIRDGADFRRVAENVRGFTARARARGVARPQLEIVFVAMRRNVHELPDVVGLAAEWDVGRVWVQNLSHSFSDTQDEAGYDEIRAFTTREALWPDPPAAALRAFDAARRRARALGVELRLPQVRPTRRRRPGEPGCDWPWQSAYVRHDGRLQPCCMLMGSDRGILGDLSQTSFARAWAGERYARFRAALETDEPPSECRGCAMYRGTF